MPAITLSFRKSPSDFVPVRHYIEKPSSRHSVDHRGCEQTPQCTKVGIIDIRQLAFVHRGVRTADMCRYGSLPAASTSTRLALPLQPFNPPSDIPQIMPPPEICLKGLCNHRATENMGAPRSLNRRHTLPSAGDAVKLQRHRPLGEG